MPAVHRGAFLSRVLRSNLGPDGGTSRTAAAASRARRRRRKILMPEGKAPLKSYAVDGTCAAAEYDVFISHRGVDAKRTMAALLYDRLVQLGLRPFLDNRTIGLGDKFVKIDEGVAQSKVGIAVLSPGYTESVFCLNELAMLVESGKKLIPIFFDVKPSDLKMGSRRSVDVPLRPEELERFERALREAKYTVGLTFDTRSGNWSDLVSTTVESVLRCMRQETACGRR